MPEQTSRPLIADRRVVTDEWVLCEDATQRPKGQPALLPLADWQASSKGDDVAPWLPSDTEMTDALARELDAAPLVAIDFPKFTDGRGYSIARLLRERHGYQGQIRAIGDVLIDQLFYMSRCGFDAFLLREDQIVEDALNALSTFSRSYQPGTDDPEPLFRRRLREAHKGEVA
ncbi:MULTISPECIES: DUF934 domain-containing protein [Halomonas]|uniref:Oxidoreductase n=1 Tax=Halomonas halophila TaxID=29573 RepID=A0ABQ0U6K1_9GAMM|nr:MULTISPECIES: DUF934 domain-containing protein [Halomonas]MDR5888418.1 DUF934 domain-containing protein [Halomonas salina]RAH36609.1 DUF934 domain-containing protein [Halomonas sp. SL1]WJY05761.1 DUF934 domain-containing protein [Halomonas halophila]GEK74144.1 hypothetical protein HHA04nite_26880 [Halomonas halophila]